MFKLKEDKKSKSLSFFLQDKRYKIDLEKLMNKLNNLSKRNNKNSRICIHKSLKSSIQIMLILFRKGEKAKPHFHTIEEYNFIIKGKLEILFYNKKGNLYKTHIAKKNDLIIYDKNIIHNVKAFTEKVFFLEIRKGPFSRKMTPKYPRWVV